MDMDRDIAAAEKKVAGTITEPYSGIETGKVRGKGEDKSGNRECGRKRIRG